MSRPYRRIQYAALDVPYYDIKTALPVEGVTFYILQEDAFVLLQENNFALLLENAP